MKSQKVIVEIKVESLSIDVLRGMLSKALDQIEQEAETGSLEMQDGDLISWTTSREAVEF